LCEWNDETKTPTIPSEKEGNKVLECKDLLLWKMAMALVEKDKLDRKAKKKINPETFIDLDNVRSIKSIHLARHVGCRRVDFVVQTATFCVVSVTCRQHVSAMSAT